MPFDLTKTGLERFVEAQDRVYDTVCDELALGAKTSHWMWFIFPQLKELGRSPVAKYYGIESKDEARAYWEPSPSGVMIGSVGASTVPLAYPSWAYWGAEGKPESCSWINGVVNRRNKNVAAVALANKNARIVWALLAHERDFRPD